ncbi:alpha/beta fold hydrolase [Ornithinibacillus massiliensis]|uniref:Alpha/beta fold hydrolase n=2 Tax=Ornithinibacillus massiliensis TaxID=1944633 RepID=A0ABS5MF97_9BACI|nr:alpha/beta fold hydrolase [Ornithinibacillus massiliensis]
MWIKSLIETERGVFEVFEKGEGEPLAVTHHYSAYNEKGNRFANFFTEHHHVYLINLKGAGNSAPAKDVSEYSMDAAVLDLEAIREALGIKQWGFAGHSAGGMLALKYAIISPHSLTKIIAGGAAASKEYGEDPDSIYCSKNPNFNRIVEIMNLLENPNTPIEMRRKMGYEWALMSYHSEAKLQESMKKPNSGKTVGPRLDYFRKVEYPTYDIREELKSITIPSYIYAGRYDAQCPLRFGVEIAELIPNASLTIFEESNHNPFSEEEEKFAEFVRMTIAQFGGELLEKERTSIEVYLSLNGGLDNDFSLAYVTERLGIIPTETEKRGEFHPPNRIRQYRFTKWKYSTGRIETLDFEGLVNEIVHTFQDKVTIINELKEELGVEPYIGMVPYIYDGMSPGYSLTVEQMQFMVDIGVGMDLDQYVNPFTEEESND